MTPKSVRRITFIFEPLSALTNPFISSLLTMRLYLFRRVELAALWPDHRMTSLMD
jgi:hypothetical protein